MDRFTALLEAIAALAWPAIAAYILWNILPALKNVIAARAFTVKVAGLEITAQEATDQLKSQLQDLKEQVMLLRENRSMPMAVAAPGITADSASAQILWVDDNPKNNAFEIAQLTGFGYHVRLACSTEEAMECLAKERIGLIISDMGRREAGTYVSQAGLVLLQAVRKAGHEQPFIIYSSAKYEKRNHDEVKAAGGVGATSSSTVLFEWIAGHLHHSHQL